MSGLGSRIKCVECGAESFANGATITCAACVRSFRAEVDRLRSALAALVRACKEVTDGGSCPACYNTRAEPEHFRHEDDDKCSWQVALAAARALLDGGRP